MRSLNNYKNLRASSVIESMIAIAIISICSLLTVLVYITVIKNDISIEEITNRHHFHRIIDHSLTLKNYESKLVYDKTYVIEKKIQRNHGENTVELEVIIITDDNRTSYSTKLPNIE